MTLEKTPVATDLSAGEPRPAQAGRRPRRNWSQRGPYALLLFPALALVAIFMIYPIVSSVVTSLRTSDGGGLGFGNYQRFFHDPLASSVVWHTYLRGVGGVVPSYLLGLGAALALHQQMHFNKLWRVLALLPFVVSAPVGLGMWRLLLDPNTGVLSSFGVHTTDLLTNADLVWPVLLLINTWGSFQFYTMILLAGLGRIPDELYEAASVDGASRWQRLRNITLPGIASISLVACTLHFIGSFQEFNLIYVLTGGGPINRTQTLATYAYASGFSNYDMGYATTLTTVSMIIMLGTLAVAALIGLAVRRAYVYRKTTAMAARMARVELTPESSDPAARAPHRPRPAAAVPAGGSRRRKRSWQSGGAGARFGVAAVVVISLLPFLFLLSRSLDSTVGAETVSLIPHRWSLQNYVDVLKDPSLWSTNNITTPPLAFNFLNSLIVSVIATTIVVLLGLLAGYALSRWRSRIGKLSIGLLIVLQLVPLIVLVFPLYELLSKLALLGTRQGLIVAEAVIFIPLGTMFFKVFFDGIPREIEESAALDGAGVFTTLWKIVRPQAKSVVGAVTAFTLVNTWNEYLMATTLVSDANRRTLPPALQQYMSSYQFMSGASPGMQAVYLLIPTIVAAILLALTQRQLASAYEGGSIKG